MDDTEAIPIAATDDEIEYLRRGYVRNRRRSRIGLALGLAALVAILISAPVAYVLLSRQNELRHLQQTADCRSRLAAAHDNATDELWSRAISVPQDIDGARAAVAEAVRINLLRLEPDPCVAVRKLGDVVPARPPTSVSTTTTVPPPEGATSSAARSTTSSGTTSEASAPPPEPAPTTVKPGKRLANGRDH